MVTSPSVGQGDEGGGGEGGRKDVGGRRAAQARQQYLFVKGGSAAEGFLDSLGDVPPLLTQSHEVGMQRSLACWPPQLGNELPQGYQGGDQGGL